MSAAPTPDPAVVAATLEGLRVGLEADGYGLETSWNGDELLLRVFAGPAACEDCLVPKEIMRAIATQMLADGGVAVSSERIVLAYPGDDAGAHA